MIFRNVCNKIKWKHLSAVATCRHYSQHKILFFGTDNFSLPSLKRLIIHKNDIYSRLEVVTSFKSRRNPVKEYANEQKLQVHDWETIKQEHNYCSQFDIAIVVSFGHLICQNVIQSFPHGMLNVHASMLPKYRGASPIIYAIKNGEKTTGVSIMKIMPGKFDIGDVLATKEIEIADDTLMPELHDKMANMGAELLVECIRNLESYTSNPQDDSQATYAPKVDKTFCKVRWSEMSAKEIFDLYRAIYSYKHVHTTFRNEPVKLLELKKSSENVSWKSEEQIAGYIKFSRAKKKLLVYCRDGGCIEINKLLIGKKVMTSSDFNNGILSKLKESERRFE